MKSIDWNQLAELGLMARINQEVLHPLGLAVTRNPETGVSEGILVSDDGEFGYGKETKIIIDELQRKPVEPRLLAMIGGSRTEEVEVTSNDVVTGWIDTKKAGE